MFHKKRVSHILAARLSEAGRGRVSMIEAEAKAHDHLILATGKAVGSKVFLRPCFRGKRWVLVHVRDEVQYILYFGLSLGFS